jgi:hypothetical protein
VRGHVAAQGRQPLGAAQRRHFLFVFF